MYIQDYGDFMYFILSKKNILFIIISLILVILFTLYCKTFILANKNTNQGLSFNNGTGNPPSANATSEYLKNFNAYFIDDNLIKNNTKKVYITFDAGYEAGYMQLYLNH